MAGSVGCSDYTLDEGKDAPQTTKADSIMPRGADVDFHDVTVTSNRTVSGNSVTARNAPVNDNVQLTRRQLRKSPFRGLSGSTANPSWS